VDAVVTFNDRTPVGILRQLRPDIWVKGGDYFVDDTEFADTQFADSDEPGGRPGDTALPEAAVVRSWGGQAVVVPYLPGHSTTELIRLAQRDGASRRPAADKGAR
jgi:D-beta-D-heptose 7-phosphate kinase/D-beta-D-heptose 1-phosphate adenosyltransferase